MGKPVVSIFIPAYNNPIYTKKTLQSVVEQNYRPIEIVFSDDCSPINLGPLVDEFRKYESADFIIHFFRQPSNLGGDQLTFGFDHCIGKYVIYLPHDDWWIDKNFLRETVELMEQNPSCYLCVANSASEKTTGQGMIKLPGNFDAKNQWKIIEGDTYINMLGPDGIGYQAWSGIVFNLPIALALGAFHYPYFLSKAGANALGIMMDEFFVFQFLLSSIGSVAITEKIVSVRGMPETSICNSMPEWGHILGESAFATYYNLYKANLTGKYAATVKKRARGTIFLYPVERFNLKIIGHYNYALDAIILMALSYIKGRLLPIYHLCNFYKRNGFRAVIIKLQKIGLKGLFYRFFP